MTSYAELSGNLLVMRDGRVVYESSAGPADPTTGEALRAGHRFQIASISKQFTAAATLLTVEDGAVRLDDRLAKWIEGCPPSWGSITVAQLLSNTSGLGHWEDYPEIDLSAPLPIPELIAAFQARDPFHEPGSRFRYSSPGLCLLARVVELASGRPYRDFLAERIFTPLGMTDSFAGNGGDRRDLARGLSPEGEPLTRLFELDFVGRGAGDVWSTTRDLAIWVRAIAEDTLLSPEHRRDSLTPKAKALLLDGEQQHYGYGWFLGTLDGRVIQFHTGDNAGFESASCWFPETATHIVYLNNHTTTMADATFTAMLRELHALG